MVERTSFLAELFFFCNFPLECTERFLVAKLQFGTQEAGFANGDNTNYLGPHMQPFLSKGRKFPPSEFPVDFLLPPPKASQLELSNCKTN